jgi:integral membrane protein (TIGR01906 family)
VSSHRINVAIFAITFTVFGLVLLALVWSGDWAYAALANVNGVKGTTFRSFGPCGFMPQTDCFVDGPISLEGLLGWHRSWAAYATGLTVAAPLSFGRSIFTPDEYAHMADVRGVFRGAEILAAAAFAVAAFRLWRARREGQALRLVRDGGLVAAALVAVVGVVAIFAFDPLFLLFHELFFPQGNFLFDPATSNLLRLYPEWYWQGITAGVAISFIAIALLAAAAAHLALRRASTTYTRAA